MKTISNIPAETFDMALFRNKYGPSDRFPISMSPQGDGTLTISVPDYVPDDAQVIFEAVDPTAEKEKLASAIIADNLHDDAEWAKLSVDVKLDRIRAALLKSSALQISGKADAAEIALVAAADVAPLVSPDVEVKP